MKFIQFTSLLLFSGISSLPAELDNDDHKLNRRLIQGLAYVDMSDLRVLSPESNTFKLNYIGGYGNYHGPDVVYFNPFVQQPPNLPQLGLPPQALSQPQGQQRSQTDQQPQQQLQVPQQPQTSQQSQQPLAPQKPQAGQPPKQQPQLQGQQMPQGFQPQTWGQQQQPKQF